MFLITGCLDDQIPRNTEDSESLMVAEGPANM